MSFTRHAKYRPSGVEWMGDVPEHWAVDRLKRSSVSVKNGIWGDEPTGGDDDIICVRVADFDRGRLVVDMSDPTIRSVSASERSGRLLRPGDLLLEKSGGGENQPVGAVVLYDDRRDAVCSNFVARVAVSPAMSPSFWRYVHAAAYAVRLNVKSIKQNTGIQNLDSQQYFDELAAFPPTDEQVAIAAFLDRETAKIDALVAEQERLIDLLKEKRQAVISHAVTKGLNPAAPTKESGTDWIGNIPAHWDVRKLKHMSPRLAGRLIVQPHQYFADEGVPILFGNNIGRGELHLEDLRYISADADREFASCRVSAGDLLTVRVGDPGATVVVPPALDGCHFASAMWIRQSAEVDSEWLCHVMNSPVVAAQIEAVNYGAAQEQFNIRDAANFVLPVPPLDEQRALVASINRIVGSFDALSAEAGRASELLRERRAALISAAVTGQIDVRAAADRSAA